MRLALDIGLTGFPLGIERVEGEIEIMLGRFAGERLATEKRQSCYAMPESSLQYAVPSAKKEKAGGEGSGKRLWENRKWRKFFRQVSFAA